jgi:hypothetical protein
MNKADRSEGEAIGMDTAAESAAGPPAIVNRALMPPLPSVHYLRGLAETAHGHVQSSLRRFKRRGNLLIVAGHGGVFLLGLVFHGVIVPAATRLIARYYQRQGPRIVIAIDDAYDPHNKPILDAIREGYGNPPGHFWGDAPRLDPKSDHGRPSGARALAKEIVSAPEVLAVVGHFDSSQTKEAIQTYCRDGTDTGGNGEVADMPLFMPNDTATDLAPEAHDRGCHFAFRLAPADDSQARVATRLATPAGPHRIALFVDQSRYFYSNSLADDIRDDMPRDPDITIVAEIAFDGSAGKVAIDPLLLNLDADTAIVIASPSGAEEVIRQGQAAGWHPTTLIFSDSVASKWSDIQHLAKIIQGGPNPTLTLPPSLYFLFPTPDADIAIKHGKSAFDTYYKGVGRLLRRAVDDVGWPMTRARFADAFERVSRGGSDDAVKVGFDRQGGNRCVAFHSFKLEGDALIHWPERCAGDELQEDCLTKAKTEAGGS